MSPDFNQFRPEQRQYKNLDMARNIISRFNFFSLGPQYLEQILPPELLQEAQEEVARIQRGERSEVQAEQSPATEIAAEAMMKTAYPETAAAAGAAVVPEMLAESGDDVPAPYLADDSETTEFSETDAGITFGEFGDFGEDDYVEPAA